MLIILLNDNVFDSGFSNWLYHYRFISYRLRLIAINLVSKELWSVNCILGIGIYGFVFREKNWYFGRHMQDVKFRLILFYQ